MFAHSSLINPYQGITMWEFILLFVERMGALITGQLSFDYLASDEIQVLVLMGVAISSSLVGTFLVLRRMTMLANSLSHTILVGIVLAFIFSSFLGSSEDESGSYIAPMEMMIVAALLTGFFTTFLTEFLVKTAKLQEDASTGLVFTSLFALGVILVTILTRNAHIGTEAVMGNADALHRSDLFWVYMIVASNVLLFSIFFKEFKLTTFDAGLAYAMGFSPIVFNYLLMAQVSATTITSFRAVGVLLVLAFMTGPALSARLLTHYLGMMLIWAAGIGSFSALIGVALTRHILTVYGVALSTSGVVVCVILSLYFCVVMYVRVKEWSPSKAPI
ncbi:MAG: metal ABC transporter permease [Parachlamydiaceae bacterium]